jgi:broad specificity phosphatase PhoE
MLEKAPNNIESSEVPKGRNIDLYLFRHGEAEDKSLEAGLSERGVEQAKEAAKNLLTRVIGAGGGVIKFISSPVKRAKQTSDIMRQTIQETITEEHLDQVRLMTSRDRDTLKAGGVIGPLTEQGVDDPVNYWLENPDTLEGKSPKEIAARVQGVIDTLQKIADRLPQGEKIFYIGITHEVPQAALLNDKSGKTLNELSGNIQNCESIEIKLKGGSDTKKPEILFRGQSIQSDDPASS